MSLIVTSRGIDTQGYSSSGTNAASVTSQALDPDSSIHYVFGEMSYTSETALKINMTCLDSSGSNIALKYRLTRNGTTSTLSSEFTTSDIPTTYDTLGNLDDTTIGGERLSFMFIVDNKLNASIPYSIPTIFGSTNAKSDAGTFRMHELYMRTMGSSPSSASPTTKFSQFRFAPAGGTGSIEQWRITIYKLTS